jgi:hypothetical protein
MCNHYDCNDGTCRMVYPVYVAGQRVAEFATQASAREWAQRNSLNAEVQVGDVALPGENPHFADSFWKDGVEVFPHLEN